MRVVFICEIERDGKSVVWVIAHLLVDIYLAMSCESYCLLWNIFYFVLRLIWQGIDAAILIFCVSPISALPCFNMVNRSTATLII